MSGTIPFKPKTHKSANIQAELYRQCKNEGIKCYLEYTHGKCRFDAVIVKNEQIILIIEVKNYRYDRSDKPPTKQRLKYEAFGVPLIWLTGYRDLNETMREIRGRWYGESEKY